jgi:hypothetical protein
VRSPLGLIAVVAAVETRLYQWRGAIASGLTLSCTFFERSGAIILKKCAGSDFVSDYADLCNLTLDEKNIAGMCRNVHAPLDSRPLCRAMQ